MWPGFDPGPSVISGLSLLLVLFLVRGFFSWFSGFPPSTKINISKFQFDREFEGHGFVSHMTVMCNSRKNKVDYYYYYYRFSSHLQLIDLQSGESIIVNK